MRIKIDLRKDSFAGHSASIYKEFYVRFDGKTIFLISAIDPEFDERQLPKVLIRLCFPNQRGSTYFTAKRVGLLKNIPRIEIEPDKEIGSYIITIY